MARKNLMTKVQSLDKGMKDAIHLLKTAEQMLYSDPKKANDLIGVARAGLDWCSIKLHQIQGHPIKE